MSKAPPSMPEAEQYVIGACLIETAAIGMCAEMNITGDHFYTQSLRKAWQDIIQLYRNSRVADIITVAKLGTSHHILDECIDTFITMAHLQHYIEILKEYEQYRRVLRVGKEMCSDAYDTGLSSDTLLSKTIDNILGKIEVERMSVSDMHEMHKEKRMRAKSDGVVGSPVKLEALRVLVPSWEPPDCVVVAGKSSSGKTAFVLSEFLEQAIHGTPIGIYEADMTADQLYERMASNIACVNAFKFKSKYWTDEEAHEMDRAYELLETLPIYVNDKANPTMADVNFFGTICGLKHNVKLFCLDFLTQINFTQEELRMGSRMAIGQHAAKIKGLGKRYDYCTFIISQLSRHGDKTADVTPAVPNKEALKESGEIENNADIVAIVAKKPDRPIDDYTFKHRVWDMCINVDKQRQGPTGLIDMGYEPRFHQYFTCEEADERRNKYDIERCENERMQDQIK